MIELLNVSKSYPTRGGDRTVLKDINLAVGAGQKIGIFGRNGAGKSTLIRLLSEIERPDSGRIVRTMRMSWPLAFSGAFQGSLTGSDNVRFVSRIYGADHRNVMQFVNDFSELGAYLHEPVKHYSSGMRARLAFALSMAIEFDCFLIDEVVSVGDKSFHDKCHAELFGKRGDKAMIIVSHDPTYIREHCDSAAVLSDGHLHNFASVDEAYAFYETGSP